MILGGDLVDALLILLNILEQIGEKTKEPKETKEGKKTSPSSTHDGAT